MKRAALLAALALTLASGAAAGDHTWTTVGDDTLAGMRGGFDLGGGVTVSFGITRSVAVNGVLVATTSFQVPDLGRITPAQAAMFEKTVGGAASLVQVGGGNTLAAGALPATTTVIQNSLNGQAIQTRTLIDTTTNGMSLIKGLNAGTALHDALLQAVR